MVTTGSLYPVAKALLRPATKVIWPVTVEGAEHLPPTGPAILAANHISFLDSVVLIGVLPRRVTYVGKAEYLDSWKTRYLFPAVGMIPVDRSGGEAAAGALSAAAEVLQPRGVVRHLPRGHPIPRRPAAPGPNRRGPPGRFHGGARGARRHPRDRPDPTSGRLVAPAVPTLRDPLRALPRR